MAKVLWYFFARGGKPQVKYMPGETETKKNQNVGEGKNQK
jgi:hypothetical protein